MVVMDDADVDLAVEGALFGGFGTAGQRCTSLGTAIVHESTSTTSSSGVLDERLRAAPIGDPTQDVLYGPMIHERFAERFEDWLGLIRDHHTPYGSSAIGRITADTPRDGFVGDPEAGLFYHPTFVTGVGLEDELYRTETFGPLVGVARFERFDEAMELANAHGYGLSSAIYTTSGAARLRASASRSRPAWSRSTTPPPAPRRTCRSAATASRATARASPASGCSTSSRAGSR